VFFKKKERLICGKTGLYASLTFKLRKANSVMLKTLQKKIKLCIAIFYFGWDLIKDEK
jgi:hypothetical protein